ncbi:MAG: fluoride efflux transporter CrcB [Arcicella sp.]|jgi:fluoride exporter|nr:fluoride efflux transporter CrcB [Arcicella sp.]
MNQLILIFIGGGLGSLTRFSLSKLIQENLDKHFPLGTLGVNVLASIILGLFVGLVEAKSLTNPNYKALIAIGFCGGFSTFSTFSNDTLQLIQNNRVSEALLNILLNVVLCILATFGGITLAKI